MRFAKPHVFASAVLVSWACAKTSDSTDDPGAYTPPGTTGGRGGTSSRSGSGGTTPNGSGGTFAPTGGSTASGGSSTASGGSSGTGANGSGGTDETGGTMSDAGRSNGMAGRAAMAGRPGTGGTGTGGTGTGGTNSTGGGSGKGVGGAGGVMAMTGGTSGGSMGAAGLPNDPNWKPPDMTATAKLLVLYKAEVTDASSTEIRMTLTMQNKTDTPYDLSQVTMRYWMSSEPPPDPHTDYSYDGLMLSKTLQFVPNNANSYIKFTFGKGGVVPPSTDPNAANQTQIQARVQEGQGVNPSTTKFNQTNDWSFDKTATAAKANPKMTIYDGSTLIWGCEPSHVCAGMMTGGDTGGGGQGGAP